VNRVNRVNDSYRHVRPTLQPNTDPYPTLFQLDNPLFFGVVIKQFRFERLQRAPEARTVHRRQPFNFGIRVECIEQIVLGDDRVGVHDQVLLQPDRNRVRCPAKLLQRATYRIWYLIAVSTPFESSQSLEGT